MFAPASSPPQDSIRTTLSSNEGHLLLTISGICISALVQTLRGDGAPLAISIAFSGLAYATTYALIRWLGPAFMRIGLKGKDMSKVKKIEMCVGRPSFDCSASPEVIEIARLTLYCIIDLNVWALFVPLYTSSRSSYSSHSLSTRTLLRRHQEEGTKTS